jgi:hypothetical protein
VGWVDGPTLAAVVDGGAESLELIARRVVKSGAHDQPVE